MANSVTVSIPEEQLVLVEYPGYLQNSQEVIRTLGGNTNLAAAFTSDSPFLRLTPRPDDPLSHPLYGDRSSTTGILLRISKTRSNQGVADGAALKVAAVARVHAKYQFKGLADLQYLSCPHNGESDAANPLLLVPPLLSKLDVPLDYAFAGKTGTQEESNLPAIPVVSFHSASIPLPASTGSNAKNRQPANPPTNTPSAPNGEAPPPSTATTTTTTPSAPPTTGTPASAPSPTTQAHTSQPPTTTTQPSTTNTADTVIEEAPPNSGGNPGGNTGGNTTVVPPGTDAAGTGAGTDAGTAGAPATADAATAPADESGVPGPNLLEEKLRGLLQERPIWALPVLQLRVPGVPKVELFAQLHALCYQFKSGPWRRVYIRRGYDPRYVSESRGLQVVSVDIKAKTSGSSSGDPGTKAVVQLCDICDPAVSALVQSAPYADSCGESSGWFLATTWQQLNSKIRALHRKGALQSLITPVADHGESADKRAAGGNGTQATSKAQRHDENTQEASGSRGKSALVDDVAGDDVDMGQGGQASGDPADVSLQLDAMSLDAFLDGEQIMPDEEAFAMMEEAIAAVDGLPGASHEAGFASGVESGAERSGSEEAWEMFEGSDAEQPDGVESAWVTEQEDDNVMYGFL